jgi:hypothetical protein
MIPSCALPASKGSWEDFSLSGNSGAILVASPAHVEVFRITPAISISRWTASTALDGQERTKRAHSLNFVLRLRHDLIFGFSIQGDSSGRPRRRAQEQENHVIACLQLGLNQAKPERFLEFTNIRSLGNPSLNTEIKSRSFLFRRTSEEPSLLLRSSCPRCSGCFKLQYLRENSYLT